MDKTLTGGSREINQIGHLFYSFALGHGTLGAGRYSLQKESRVELHLISPELGVYIG